MALSGATIQGQSEPGSNGNEGVLRISQSPSITGTSPSDCLVSYAGPSLMGGGGSYSSAEKQLLYFTAPADWTKCIMLPIFFIGLCVCVCVCTTAFIQGNL